MALYLLDKNKDGAAYLGDTLKEALENVQRCKQCRILTSDEYCRICSDSSRDQSSLCIVESPSDVLAIESTGGFKGRYFVLMGRLSPIDGIAPEDLGIPDLLQYIKTIILKKLFWPPAQPLRVMQRLTLLKIILAM
ncbi:MAG: hypothetical protein CM15mP17_08510 [Gammaproteobacteria bacterium]|nr:MAG: hypothetical protein CM15mP17_08510 [Gammaproteobacteria bacterium]